MCRSLGMCIAINCHGNSGFSISTFFLVQNCISSAVNASLLLLSLIIIMCDFREKWTVLVVILRFLLLNIKIIMPDQCYYITVKIDVWFKIYENNKSDKQNADKTIGICKIMYVQIMSKGKL